MVKHSRKNKRIRRNKRTIRQRGGVKSVFCKFGNRRPMEEYNNINTVGELCDAILARTSLYATQIIYGGRDIVNERDTPLINDATYEILKLTKKLTPLELCKFMLDDSKYDIHLINRCRLKFAASGTGSQDFNPYKLAMKIYAPEEKQEFKNCMNTHFGFEIEYTVNNFTIYDKDMVDNLFNLFKDKGYFTGIETIEELLKQGYTKEHRDRFFDFIYIIFGEVQDIPGVPQPLFMNEGHKKYDYTPGIKFTERTPEIQAIILEFIEIVRTVV